ncbi:hypothetical protein WJX72_009349 [[Myrmecia] bisecta]|uniref:protein disulfide-isomerase n=1 Tax=[Myrmecia] bisecta TaxID=41462 RepID=A0AAW1PTJ5_9CHLO
MMKLCLATICLSLLTVAVFAADDPTVKLEGVVDLTPDNFDKIVTGGKHVLVEFYAPWCGHCKHLTPIYKELGATVNKDPKLKNRVVIAKVDADAHKSLGERFEVRGFPTIKHFARGQPVSKPDDYTGGRTHDDFVAFLRGKLAADKTFARVAALDNIVGSYADAADKTAVLKELQDKAGKLTDSEEQEHAKLYIKFVTKANEKGSDYFANEQSRLERILETGSVSSAKAGEISQKLSVLTAFTEPAGQSEADEDEEDDDDDEDVDDE